MAVVTAGAIENGPMLGSGWAESIAGALAQAGATVAVASVDSDLLDATMKVIEEQGQKGLPLQGHFEDEKEVAAALKKAVSGRAGLDVLVNAPKAEFFAPALEISTSDWTSFHTLVVDQTFTWCREAATLMSQRGCGRIVNVISGLSRRGMANASAFSATQGALESMTRSLALEWAPLGIRVNGIGTGWCRETMKPPKQQLQEPLVRYLPLRRRGVPSDVGSLAVYLASEASSFVSGQTIFVDGGALAHA